MRITLQIYSGRPNPTWELDEVATRELARRIAELASADDAGGVPSGLGYQGLSSDELHVYRDRVWSGERVFADPHATVEAWLIATGPAQLHDRVRPRRYIGAPKPFAHYDQRRFATFDVATGYARWAPSYDSVDDRLDIDLLEASPRLAALVHDARIVDLGCGTGRIGVWLNDHGAREVVGVDATEEMLDRAAAREIYARTHRATVTATDLDAGTFDGAVCSMVLDHVADLAGFFSEAHRLLRPGGWLMIVDFHPFFLMRGVPTHFADAGEQVAIENHVHALRDFFQLAAGFTPLEFEERFVTDEWALAVPGYTKHVGLPVTFSWLYQRT